jgi:hypothetical protein
MKKLVILVLTAASFAALPNISRSQPKIDWSVTLGGSQRDWGYGIATTPGGGCVFAGFSNSADGDITGHHGPTSTSDCLVGKLDANGKVLWMHSYGGSGNDAAINVILVPGGYVFCGGTASTDGDVKGLHGTQNSDAWVVKLDTNGNILWQHCYGGSLEDDATRIVATSDGGYLFAARSYSNDGDVTGHHGSTTGSDYWVVKIDSVGNIQWEKSYGGTGNDAPFGLTRTDDNGYVLCGDCTSNDGDVTGNHGGSDIWVMKINDTGKLLWENSFGGPGDEDNNTVTLAADGGYIIGGSAYYSGGDIKTPHYGHNDEYDIWVFKLSRDGSLVWEKSYGGTGRDYEQDVHATPDGGCLVTGYTTSNDIDVSGHHGDTSNYDGWVFKIDSNGLLQWQKCVGGTKMEGLTGIALTDDGGCVIAGNTQSSDGDVSKNQGNADAWIVRFAPFLTGPSSNVLDVATISNSSIYPNPATSELTITGIPSGCSAIDVYDALGRRVMVVQHPISDAEIILNIQVLPEGFYLVCSITNVGSVLLGTFLKLVH